MLLELSTIALCTLAVISVRGAIIETRRVKVLKRKSAKLDEIRTKHDKNVEILEIIEQEQNPYLRETWLDILQKEQDKIDKLFEELEEIK